jgi:hypothetical protein
MSKQEPVAHVYRIEANGRPCVAWDDASEIKVGAKLYAAPREWVGLTVNEARDFYESDLSREDLIHKIDEFLEEKNHG